MVSLFIKLILVIQGYFLENSNINYSALVIEGFGSGNVSEFLLPKIQDLLSNEIPVAICTRVPEGPYKD